MKNSEKQDSLDPQKLLRQLQQKTGDSKRPKYDPLEHNDKTRSHIARFLTYSYVGLVGTVLIGMPIYNAHLPSGYSALDIKDALLAISGVFGSTYGIVIAHFFKRND